MRYGLSPRLATFVLAGCVALAGCASAAGPQPEPRAVPAPGETPERVATEAPLRPSEASLRAAEGIELTGLETGTMWTFENPPLDYWEATYGFRPDDAWLEHVRLSSVRYGEICSASFVSAAGLVMTNHHCARDCAEAVSTESVDYVTQGFYAASPEEELVCPDLYLDQLVEIEEVTARVKAAAPEGASDSAAVAAREAEREAIEEACEADSGLECQVVSLYHGGQYQLYTYRRYSPVKLVFLPELQAGFFGGDPDNFTYPRYALDVAFARAYEADGSTAARTPHHFEWDPEGAAEGEPVFLTGNPGSTSRLATVAQVMYEQRFRHPFIVTILEGQRELLRSIAVRGPEAERAVRDDLFSVENSLKAFSGQLAGLRDTTLIGRKIAWQRAFRDRVAARPELADGYSGAWDRMAGIQTEKLATSPPLNVNNPDFLGGPYEATAASLVRYARQMALPEAERDSAYRGEALAETEAGLRGPIRADPEVAARLLELRLRIAHRFLPPDDPFRALAFRSGESPEAAAGRLIRQTSVLDPEFRNRIMEGGAAAPAEAEDPLLRIAAHMVEALPGLQRRWEEITASESATEERLADALFAVYGTEIPPDATFTLRISDGVMRRYPYNGTFAPSYTTYFGLYARAAEFGNEDPWTLPASFAARRDEVALAAPLDFVTTNDITGGNSGSPMIDREARIVGLAFDGNIEQLPNEFVFTTEAARSIGVHSAGIVEALRSIYRADALLAELLGDDGDEEAGPRAGAIPTGSAEAGAGARRPVAPPPDAEGSIRP